MNVLRVLFDFNECLKESVRFPCATVLCTQTGAQHFLWRPVGLPTPMVFFLLFLHKMWYGSPGFFLMERRAGIWRLVLGNANKAKGGRTEKDEGRKRRGTDGSEQTTKQGRGSCCSWFCPELRSPLGARSQGLDFLAAQGLRNGSRGSHFLF